MRRGGHTAITRAIEKIFIFAQDYAFKVACKNFQEAERQTFLKLWGEEKEEKEMVVDADEEGAIVLDSEELDGKIFSNWGGMFEK